MAKDKKPRGLGRTSGVTAPSAVPSSASSTSSARFNPLASSSNNKSRSQPTSNGEEKQEGGREHNDQEMSDASVPAQAMSTGEQQQQQGGDEDESTASIALKDDGEAGDELAELRQTYEAAQKQFSESGTQEYLRGTIHECDRMVRNCGEEVYPSSEFNYIYASALHDFSLIGAEDEERNGFVDLALDYVSHAADLMDKENDQAWLWKYYLVAGKVNLQKADALYEEQEAASSKKQFKTLGDQIHTTLAQATNLLDAGFKGIPEGEEKHVVRLDAKSIEKVGAKEHEKVSAAANVALHADRFEEYDRRKQWNTWALETYRQVTQDTPENVEAWQGIATCMHSIVGWWADQADEEEENDNDDEEDEEEPEDEYSLPVYATERGQMSLQATKAVKKAIELARKSNALTSDLLTLGAECHLNLVNIAVGDKAAAEQSKRAVALIKEAMATFPDPALEERYAEVLQEFEEIAGNRPSKQLYKWVFIHAPVERPLLASWLWAQPSTEYLNPMATLTTTYDPLHPPREPLSGRDPKSFGYTTLQSRLPVIVSKIVDDVCKASYALSDYDAHKAEKEQEAKQIIEAIGGLRYELQRDKPFRPLKDDLPDVEQWNQSLADYYPTSSWFKASWLFAECYLYRRVKEAFALTQHWRDYDPFFVQKRTVFKSSQKAVVAIAKQLMSPTDENNRLSALDVLMSQGRDSKGTREVFFELAQVCLWGNATDLSLLDNPDLAKVEELQRRMMMGSSSGSGNNSKNNSVSNTPKSSHNSSTAELNKQPQEEQEDNKNNDSNNETSELKKHAEKILQNDSELLWEKIKNMRNGRVDIVLDNAGFELYVDLVFADYLIRAGFASHVVFHAKAIPWFVSDVMLFDFQWTLNQLYQAGDPTASSSTSSSSESFFNPSDKTEQQALKDLGKKWHSYVEQGIWRVTTHDFWTSCYAFYHLPSLPSAQDLFQDMKQSDLWIFKGDLNYRKLVYDCQWPTTTPFIEAIGPLGEGNSSSKDNTIPSLVSLRTCKADVVVGLKEGVAEKVKQQAENWMVSGEYAVISFSP
ncbi:hypothetical protein EDD11_006681 [Mortierella claussenii]|nr:hypothetical protein EDD11_006681 [Mortierella claussenii]